MNSNRFPKLISAFATTILLTNAVAMAASQEKDLADGEKAPAFVAKTTDGKEVKFPQSYKGKIVLLDFWATWCPPCRAELPNLVEVYNRFHGKGFEVLGISLDRANFQTKLAQFTSENKMPWPQIYDGKYWQAALAQQYNIQSIPRPILVDGDTGLILAQKQNARGARLGPTVEKALANKKKN
jgi:peroxiredoxin